MSVKPLAMVDQVLHFKCDARSLPHENLEGPAPSRLRQGFVVAGPGFRASPELAERRRAGPGDRSLAVTACPPKL